MKKNGKINFRVKSKPGTVTVEVDTGAQALYVYFQRGAKIARTVIQNQLPMFAVDLDKDGEVIGVEACGVGEFTLKPVLEQARVTVPQTVLNSARYLPTAALAVS